MFGFVVKRLLLLFPVFFAVSLIIFLIVHLVPGDPIDNLIRIGATPQQKLELAAKYGLDKPLFEQYWVWLSNLFRGDLGDAIVLRRPVATLIGKIFRSVSCSAVLRCFSHCGRCFRRRDRGHSPRYCR